MTAGSNPATPAKQFVMKRAKEDDPIYTKPFPCGEGPDVIEEPLPPAYPDISVGIVQDLWNQQNRSDRECDILWMKEEHDLTKSINPDKVTEWELFIQRR